MSRSATTPSSGPGRLSLAICPRALLPAGVPARVIREIGDADRIDVPERSSLPGNIRECAPT
jgi:hypothetical protein